MCVGQESEGEEERLRTALELFGLRENKTKLYVYIVLAPRLFKNLDSDLREHRKTRGVYFSREGVDSRASDYSSNIQGVDFSREVSF